MKTKLVALIIVVALAAAAVGAGATLLLTRGQDDTSSAPKAGSVGDWRAELTAAGANPSSWERYEKYVKTDLCKMDDYDYFVTLTPNEPEDLAQTRVGIKYGCPDRLKDWDAAIANLDDVQADVDYLCDTPMEELSADDQQKADAICVD